MRKLRSQFAVLTLLAAFFTGSAWAASSNPEGAKAYASNIGSQVLSILGNANRSQSQKMDSLEAMFVKVVDVDWVGKFVLGRHWREATDAQKKSYLDAYRVFLIKHYTSRFAEYGGETFDIPVSREERKDEYFVRMEIKRPTGQAPIIVDYRLRYTGTDFQVFDIIVEGVSLISTQRSEFTSVVDHDGIEVLVAKLKEKTEKLTLEMQAKQSGNTSKAADKNAS